MNHSIDPANLHKLIHKALIEEWDPIGIGNIPEAQDEYDEYIATISKLLLEKSKRELFDYLWWLETIRMGLTGNRQRTAGFVDRLFDLKDRALIFKHN